MDGPGPARWWTEAEVRAALGSRIALESVEYGSPSAVPAGDGTVAPRWCVRYVLGRDEGRLIAELSIIGGSHSARAPTCRMIDENGESGLAVRLESVVAGECRAVELSLRPGTRFDVRMGEGLFRLYEALWPPAADVQA